MNGRGVSKYIAFPGASVVQFDVSEEHPVIQSVSRVIGSRCDNIMFLCHILKSKNCFPKSFKLYCISIYNVDGRCLVLFVLLQYELHALCIQAGKRARRVISPFLCSSCLNMSNNTAVIMQDEDVELEEEH